MTLDFRTYYHLFLNLIAVVAPKSYLIEGGRSEDSTRAGARRLALDSHPGPLYYSDGYLVVIKRIIDSKNVRN